MKKDARVDAYIDKAAPFARPILRRLRKIVHTGCPDGQETVKWGMPHFEHTGLLCGMAAFKNHCAFWFWNRALVIGPDSERGMAQFGRLQSLDDLRDEKKLIGYVRKAAALNEKGVKRPARPRPKKKSRLQIPDYFSAALKKNARAQKTFENFNPTNQREYVEWMTEAKREETRQQRMKMSILWLAEGKPRNWKYIPQWR